MTWPKLSKKIKASLSFFFSDFECKSLLCKQYCTNKCHYCFDVYNMHIEILAALFYEIIDNVVKWKVENKVFSGRLLKKRPTLKGPRKLFDL